MKTHLLASYPTTISITSSTPRSTSTNTNYNLQSIMRANLASASPLNSSPPSQTPNSSEEDSSPQSKVKHVAAVEDAVDGSPKAKSTATRLTPYTEPGDSSAMNKCDSCCSNKITSAVSAIPDEIRLAIDKEASISKSGPGKSICKLKNAAQIASHLVRDFEHHVKTEQNEFRIRGDTDFVLDTTRPPQSRTNTAPGRRGTFSKDYSEHQLVEEHRTSSKPQSFREGRPSGLSIRDCKCPIHEHNDEELYDPQAYKTLASERWHKAQRSRLDGLLEPRRCRVHDTEEISAYSRFMSLFCGYLSFCRDDLAGRNVPDLFEICLDRFLREQNPRTSSLLSKAAHYLELQFPHHLRSPLMSPHIYPGSRNASKRAIDERTAHFPAEIKSKVTDIEELTGDDNEVFDSFTACLLEDLLEEEEDEQVMEVLRGEIAVQQWKTRRSRGSRRVRRRERRRRAEEKSRAKEWMDENRPSDYEECCSQLEM